MWVSVGSILKEFKKYANAAGTGTRVSSSGPDCCKNPQEYKNHSTLVKE